MQKNVILVILIIIIPLVLLVSLLSGESFQKHSTWQLQMEAAVTTHRAMSWLGRTPFSFNQKVIYFGDADGHVFALNKQSGKKLWQFTTYNYSPYPITTSDSTLVYVSDFDGRIYALDRNTGKERWRFVIPGFIQPDTEPMLLGDFVYVGDRGGNLWAIDKHSGELRWSYKTRGIDPTYIKTGVPIYHFGVLIPDRDSVYIQGANGSFYALDAATGKELWQITPYRFALDPPVIDKDMLFIKSGNDTILAVERKSGTVQWQLQADGVLQGGIAKTTDRLYVLSQRGSLYILDKATGVGKKQAVGEKTCAIDRPLVIRGRVFLLCGLPGRSGRLVSLDKNGEVLWMFESPGLFLKLPIIHQDLLLVGGKEGVLYALDFATGNVIWKTLVRGDIIRSPVTSSGYIFVPSVDAGKIVHLYALDAKTGSIYWEINDIDLDIKSLTYAGNSLYFLSEDNKRTNAMLISKKINQNALLALKKPRSSSDQRGGDQKPDRFLSSFRSLYSSLQKKLSRIWQGQNIYVSWPGVARVYTTHEFTIAHTDTFYDNVWEEVNLQGTFIHQDGTTITIPGFYYDKDTWKIRFVPTLPGVWQWKITFNGGGLPAVRKGELLVTPSATTGFVRIDPINRRRLMFDNGQPFPAIGFQDAIQDYNLNGDPLDQWGSIDNKPVEKDVIQFTDMNTYFSTYHQNSLGFNLYRWGVANASFKLWKTISPEGNRYGVNEGIWGDNLVTALRNNGFRTWMTIFGFEPPFSYAITNKANQKAIRHYLDYVVARYAAYVDIWELTNEASPDSAWVVFAARYLRSIDPYKHPIATSWERPDIDEIDINSIHWFDSEPESMSDLLTSNIIRMAKNWDKPVVISEQGNKNINWDTTSAKRMRIHSWTAYFQEATLIFWNVTRRLYKNPDNANIYLGAEELKYITILQDIIKDVDADIKPIALTGSAENIRAYGLQSSKYVLGYFYHFTDTAAAKTTLRLSLPTKGTLYWINPSDGVILSSAQLRKGFQTLTTPPFTEDLAMKIVLSPEP